MPDCASVRPTARTLILLLALAAGALMFYRLLVHMQAMTALMGDISRSVASMSADMSAMRASMQRLDSTLGRGARDLQQLNPMQMILPERN